MHLFQAVTGLGGQPSKFRDICTPQERWKKHLNIVKGNPNHVSVVIERTASSKIAFKKPYLLYTFNHIVSGWRRTAQYTNYDKISAIFWSYRIRTQSYYSAID